MACRDTSKPWCSKSEYKVVANAFNRLDRRISVDRRPRFSIIAISKRVNDDEMNSRSKKLCGTMTSYTSLTSFQSNIEICSMTAPILTIASYLAFCGLALSSCY